MTVNFDGTGSSDPDGTITAYDWDFGDGNAAGGSTTNHVYNSAGNYTVILSVTDDGGATDTDTLQIVVDALPTNQPPTASASANPVSGTVPLAVQFNGAGSGDSDGTIVSYEWDFDDGGAASGVVVNHTYTATGVYNATLTVTDDDGASSTATVQVQVDPDILAVPVLSGSASGRVASLSWTHSGDADSFYVERGGNKRGGIQWTRIATLGAAATSYTDQPGRGSFSYRVQAFRNSPAEVSDYSNQLNLRVR
ncbi:MAG: PKD domain-containing protein [Acidobacteria bacterium]|nr:PKD domain-containing protein [Acidobacteriota bacterium]